MTSEPHPTPAPATTTPPSADALRTAVQQTLGFIPNAVEEMLISPPVTALVLTGKKLLAGASLSAREQSAIELFIAVHNGCDYCRVWHEGLGLRTGLAADEMRRIIAGQPAGDDRLRVLLRATARILAVGGRLEDSERAQLAAAGVDRRQLFEIVALVGLNVITNTINTLAATPPDACFVGALDRAT
jgi:AhpD family alkylhydroperoxidase